MDRVLKCGRYLAPLGEFNGDTALCAKVGTCPHPHARPQLTSKACEARLSVSEGGRHVARREDDKCASYGSLFIGQSSGTQVETEHGRRKAGGAGGRKDEIRFALSKAASRAAQLWVCHEKSIRLERGLLGRPNSHLAGLLMFS